MWLPYRSCGDLEVLVPDYGAGRPYTEADTVPLDDIVGTVARCCDFDGCFRPLQRHLKARMTRVRRALEGRHLPAIRLRRVDRAYYVEDGHHRLGIARERGMLAVDAIVTCSC